MSLQKEKVNKVQKGILLSLDKEIRQVMIIDPQTFLQIFDFSPKIRCTQFIQKILRHTRFVIETESKVLPKFYVKKRFTELEVFNECIKQTYKNITLPKLPSKDKDRQRVFDEILQIILRVINEYQDTRKIIISRFFHFLTVDPVEYAEKKVPIIKENNLIVKTQQRVQSSSFHVKPESQSQFVNDNQNVSRSFHIPRKQNPQSEQNTKSGILPFQNFKELQNQLLFSDHEAILKNDDTQILQETVEINNLPEKEEEQKDELNKIQEVQAINESEEILQIEGISNHFKNIELTKENVQIKSVEQDVQVFNTETEIINENQQILSESGLDQYAGTTAQKEEKEDEKYYSDIYNEEINNLETNNQYQLIKDMEQNDKNLSEESQSSSDQDNLRLRSNAVMIRQMTDLVGVNGRQSEITHQTKTLDQILPKELQQRFSHDWIYKDTQKNKEILGIQMQNLKQATQKLLFKSSSTQKIDTDMIAQYMNQVTHKLLFQEKQIQEGLLLFQGNLLIKFSSELNWTTSYCKIIDSFLFIYKSIIDNHYESLYCLYKCDFDLYKINETDFYIEIFQKLDNIKLQIKIPSHHSNYNLIDLNQNDKFYDMVRILRNSSNIKKGLFFDNIVYKPVGKICLEVLNLENYQIFDKPVKLFIKFKHSPFKISTKQILIKPGKESSVFDQQIIFPLNNHFTNIHIKVIKVSNYGFILDRTSEESLFRGDILVTDIMKYCIHEGQTFLVQLKPESKKGKLIEDENIISKYPKLRVKISNLTSISKTYLTQSITSNLIEGNLIQLSDLSTYDIRVFVNRIKRIIAHIELLLIQLEDIIHFKYPAYSWVWLILLCIFTLINQSSGLFGDLIIILIITTILNHPSTKTLIDNFIKSTFKNQNQLSNDYIEPRVETIEEQEMLHLSDLNRFKYYIPDDETILEVVARLKNLSGIVQYGLYWIPSLFEKLKNLVCWYDPYRAIFFIFVLILLNWLWNTISFGYTILIGLIGVFLDGRTWYKDNMENNRKQAENVLHYIYNKLNLDTHVEEVNKFQLWPLGIKFAELKKKIVEQTEKRLHIKLSENQFKDISSPNDYIQLISTCQSKLKFDFSEDEQADFPHLVEKQQKIKIGDFINIILNIPSDFYLIRHPRSIFQQ